MCACEIQYGYLQRRYTGMMNCAAHTSHQTGYCMHSAAACTSAPIIQILDTALVAVSILFIGLLRLLKT